MSCEDDLRAWIDDIANKEDRSEDMDRLVDLLDTANEVLPPFAMKMKLADICLMLEDY